MSKMKNKFPKIIVAGLVENNGQFLLIQEKTKSGDAFWMVPGGKAEFGESLEQAVKRELKEEVGLDIEIIKFVGFKEAIFIDHGYHTIIFFFHCRSSSSDILLEKKILDGKFFHKEEIKALNLIDSARWLFNNFKF
jgi:8-oxo-dGTP diphosphatase